MLGLCRRQLLSLLVLLLDLLRELGLVLEELSLLCLQRLLLLLALGRL